MSTLNKCGDTTTSNLVCIWLYMEGFHVLGKYDGQSNDLNQ